ncbi:MAG: MgtC/SapB family protein [Clostridia bacterium]|nr:MgtC/SapB family protein [Clostridia bacterium]
MEEFLTYIREFNAVTVCLRIVLSVLVGGAIGSERGRHGSAAGLRTHILVCVGAAMTALTGFFVNITFGLQGDVLRMAAQVISGIGFLGAGMIIVKNNNVITGLTTAAGMWATAAIGIAIGCGFYLGAFVATFACIVTAAYLTRLERQRKRKVSVHIYAEANKIEKLGDIADAIRENTDDDILVETVSAKSKTDGSIGLYITASDKQSATTLRKYIETIDGITFAVSE